MKKEYIKPQTGIYRLSCTPLLVTSLSGEATEPARIPYADDDEHQLLPTIWED